MIWGVLEFPGSCDERDALQACSLSGEARLIWHESRDLDGFLAFLGATQAVEPSLLNELCAMSDVETSRRRLTLGPAGSRSRGSC